jgi:hypothetical protein
MTTPIAIPMPDEPTSEQASPKRSKWERFRRDQGFEAGATNRISAIKVGKPDQFTWFRVHPNPDFHFPAEVFDYKPQRETFLIEPTLRNDVEIQLTPKLIVPCITRLWNIFLWPVSLPKDDGRENKWTETALDAVRQGMQSWIRVAANMDNGAYDIILPRAEMDAPVWPDLTMEQMMDRGFKNLVIDRLDHPRLKLMRGDA